LKIIDGFRKKNLITMTVLILGFVVLAAWYLVGAPIPGRYQIISSSSDSVIMVDTVTGTIRLFSYRQAGSSSHREFERKVEIFELTE
jgi:hypothetical protein